MTDIFDCAYKLSFVFRIYVNDLISPGSYQQQQQVNYTYNSNAVPVMTSNLSVNSASFSVCASSSHVLPPIKYFQSSDLLQKETGHNPNQFITTTITSGDKVYLNGAGQQMDNSNINNNGQHMIATTGFNS